MSPPTTPRTSRMEPNSKIQRQKSQNEPAKTQAIDVGPWVKGLYKVGTELDIGQFKSTCARFKGFGFVIDQQETEHSKTAMFGEFAVFWNELDDILAEMFSHLASQYPYTLPGGNKFQALYAKFIEFLLLTKKNLPLFIVFQRQMVKKGVSK